MRILAFDTVTHERLGAPLTLQQLRQASTRIVGANDYYGLQGNGAGMPTTALPADKLAFYQGMAGGAGGAEVTLMLGIEPSLAATSEECFTEATKEPKLAQLERLGADLTKLQRAHQNLRVVLRIASEMNPQAANEWSNHDPGPFIAAYNTMAERIKKGARDELQAGEASRIQFSFSPLINRHATLAKVRPFWPGPNNVDLIGCTFYSRSGPGQASDDARDNLRDYLEHFIDKTNKSCCIDELGCAEEDGGATRRAGNAQFFRETLSWLGDLQLARPIEHATVFVLADWQADLGVVLA